MKTQFRSGTVLFLSGRRCRVDISERVENPDTTATLCVTAILSLSIVLAIAFRSHFDDPLAHVRRHSYFARANESICFRIPSNAQVRGCLSRPILFRRWRGAPRTLRSSLIPWLPSRSKTSNQGQKIRASDRPVPWLSKRGNGMRRRDLRQFLWPAGLRERLQACHRRRCKRISPHGRVRFV